MNIRLHDARILSMVDNQDIIFGEVWVQGDKITYVGQKKDSSDIKWDRQIDCGGNLLMPGFKNVHTHSGMTAFRSMCDDTNLQDWLNTQIFPREAKMTEEDVYWLTKLAILEYLTSGVTSIADMYLTPDSIARACDEMGMKCDQISGLNKFGPTIQVLKDRLNNLNGKTPLQSFRMGVHAEYTCEKSLLEQVAEVLKERKEPFYVHMSETKTEVDECIGRYGITPVRLFADLGLFDYGGAIYHGVWTTPEDMDILREKGIYVVTNPSSNAKLASGIAPIKDYIDRGIKVAIGTDGPSSNNALDMFREMYLLAVLSKLRENDPVAIDALEVLKMATVNGALCMGHKDQDVLAEGKTADIIMINLCQPNMQPINNIAKNIVYSGCKSNIKMTMINGVILYEEEQFLHAEVMEIYARAQEITDRLRNI